MGDMKHYHKNPGNKIEQVKQYDQKNPENARARKTKYERTRREKFFQPLPDIRLCKEFNLGADNVIIAGDWHIPFVNKDVLNRMLDVQNEERVPTIIINGDFLDMNNIMAMAHGTQQADDTFATEIKYATTYLKNLSETFDNIYISTGNHELAWIRLTKGLSTPTMLFDMCHKPDNVTIIESDYLNLHSGDESFRVCHPKNYSKLALSVPRMLAEKYQTHIIAGHSHRVATGYDTSGKFQLVENGGLFDSRYMKYVANTTTTNPTQHSGFVWVVDGIITTF